MRGASLGGHTPRLVSLAVLFFLILTVASKTAVPLLLGDGTPPPELLYKQAILAFDYLHGGFVRRGLGGTIAALFGDVTEPRSALLFHLFSAAFLALPVVLFIGRLAAKASVRTVLSYSVFLLVSPHLFRSWSADLARTDMLVCGFIAWAALAMVHARPGLAIVFLVVGSLAHETALLFGAPLVAALAYVAYRNGNVTRSALARSCAILLVSLVAIGIALRYGVSPDRVAALAASARAKLPARTVVDAALYVQLSGWRGLEASVCSNLYFNDRYWLYLPAVPGIIGLHLVVFGAQTRLSATLFAVAAILPAIVLSLIATDLGRWACFGVFNVWLLAVALTLMKPDWLQPLSSHFWKRVALIALVCYVGRHGEFSPTWAVDAIANRAGVPQKWDGEFDQCDPGWREYLLSVINSPGSKPGVD